MNLTLKRQKYCLYGIFGEITDESGKHFCYTLEHAYSVGDLWTPKVAAGVYTCLRHDPNRLPYVTFELQNVPPFEGCSVDGILLHVLNYNNQSEGCIGVGQELSATCILESQKAFDALMELQKDVESFTLTIS